MGLPQKHPPRSGVTPVAFVTTSAGIGGAERLLAELITRLDRSRFEPVLVCLKERGALGAELAEHDVCVYDRLSDRRLDLSILSRLASVFRRERVQIVCTVGTGGDRSFWGRLAARWAGVSSIVSCPHSMGVPDRFETSNRMLTGITDAFVAVAHRQKDYLVRHEGFSSSKVHVIPNGIDLTRFAPATADPAVRMTRRIPLGAPVAGLVACLRPEKSVETLLDAAALVLPRHPTAHFVIVGDGPERHRLERLSRSLNLSSNVHFVGMCTDVRPWLHAMDVLSLVSICEAFPVSLLEAMGCSKPVVATRVGAIPEMIVDGATGLLVPPRDPQKVADSLCRLFADMPATRAMGQAAREYVQSHFDIREMVRGYEDLFHRLVRRKVRRLPVAVTS